MSNGPDACLGPGVCQSRTNCGSGGGPVCGCNGVTYPDIQSPCIVGVRSSLSSIACGVDAPVAVDGGSRTQRACGTDAQCAPGFRCCAITGLCVDATCTACCMFAPPGTRGACVTNADCASDSLYCAATTCGVSGGCVPRPSADDCGSIVAPACGCDGHTYANECWVRNAGVRVASWSACPDAG
jgi:hypothetical protein